jgi:site-specific recombinase XerC
MSRASGRWRPFAASELSPESQRYAVRALRAAFAWLVDVRYLAGNPWTSVTDPVIVERENLLKVERALPADLWARMRGYIDSQCKPDNASHWRSVRVALLLAADSGLRREELAGARRERMSPTTYGDGDDVVWQLSIIGKRNKERTVPLVPPRSKRWRHTPLSVRRRHRPVPTPIQTSLSFLLSTFQFPQPL